MKRGKSKKIMIIISKEIIIIITSTKPSITKQHPQHLGYAGVLYYVSVLFLL